MPWAGACGGECTLVPSRTLRHINRSSIWQGTESEHGVPTPLRDRLGRDVERGGFTRAVAQWCRLDDCLDDLAIDAVRRPARGSAGPLPAAGQPQQVAGRRGGQAGQPQPQVPPGAAHRAHLFRGAGAGGEQPTSAKPVGGGPPEPEDRCNVLACCPLQCFVFPLAATKKRRKEPWTKQNLAADTPRFISIVKARPDAS